MTGLLTTISGYFSRSLILGTFLPTVIFAVFFILTIYPFFPANFGLFLYLSSLATEWKLLSITFITIVLSGLLFNLNTPLIRLYEGYPWKDTWYGKWLTKQKIKKYCELSEQAKGWKTLLIFFKKTQSSNKTDALNIVKKHISGAPFSLRYKYKKSLEDICGKTADEEKIYSYINTKRTVLDRRLLLEYPLKTGLILPTKLGNVIRSFESYPEREYKMDSITLYPRLIAVIDKEYKAIIDDAKTSFDFMLNCSFLSGLMAFLLIVAGTYFGTPFKTNNLLLMWLGEIGFFLSLSIISYTGAINQAFAWGETVKSSFDLYRNSLLEQLGYKDIPTTKKEERDLWDAISLQMIDGDPRRGVKLAYQESAPVTPPPTYAVGTPKQIKLTVLKSLKPINDSKYEVILEVSNEDKSEKDVSEVVLVDTVPEGWIYHFNSSKLFEDAAASRPQPIRVTGVNPYSFSIGDLRWNQKKLVRYKIIRFKHHGDK